jgi:hypothetical protein
MLLYVPGVTSWNRPTGIADFIVGLWETGYFNKEDGAWVGDLGDVDQGYESTGAYFVRETLSPTHWMPLPAPPA